MNTNIPDEELTYELERFTARFSDRIAQATDVLESSPDVDVRDEALRRSLLYISSAVEIATGPFAGISLADMIVFVHLSHKALEVYGDDARELADVFATSKAELWTVADKAFTSEQSAQLRQVIDEWIAANPKQVRVEGIRLSDFAEAAGTAASGRALRAKGLLSSVKTASHAANQAFQLAERGMFLLHRMPFLWRMQARLLVREVLRDSVNRFTIGPDAIGPRIRQFARYGLLSVGAVAAAGVFIAVRARRRAIAGA